MALIEDGRRIHVTEGEGVAIYFAGTGTRLDSRPGKMLVVQPAYLDELIANLRDLVHMMNMEVTASISQEMRMGSVTIRFHAEDMNRCICQVRDLNGHVITWFGTTRKVLQEVLGEYCGGNRVS